jgi:MarR family transcriptional regulator, organic hydroperoxide resistance regulator
MAKRDTILEESRDFATIQMRPHQMPKQDEKRPNSPNRRIRGAIDAKRRGDPGFADFRIADSPFYLLARTMGRYSIDMENALHAIDMDLPSWRALMIVAETNPSSVSEIADRAVMRLSTMTRVVQRLERRGLLKVKRRKSDARVTEVYINSKGVSAARQVRDIASRFYNLAFHDFDAAQIDALNTLLRRVFGNLALQPPSASP